MLTLLFFRSLRAYRFWRCTLRLVFSVWLALGLATSTWSSAVGIQVAPYQVDYPQWMPGFFIDQGKGCAVALSRGTARPGTLHQTEIVPYSKLSSFISFVTAIAAQRGLILSWRVLPQSLTSNFNREIRLRLRGEISLLRKVASEYAVSAQAMRAQPDSKDHSKSTLEQRPGSPCSSQEEGQTKIVDDGNGRVIVLRCTNGIWITVGNQG